MKRRDIPRRPGDHAGPRGPTEKRKHTGNQEACFLFTGSGLPIAHAAHPNPGRPKTMFPSRNDFDSVTALLVESVAESKQKEAAATDAEDISGQEHDADQ